MSKPDLSLPLVRPIVHSSCRLRDYLDAMNSHMPPAHRSFIGRLKAAASAPGGGVRGLCVQRGGRLRDAYNEAVHELESFR